jgi:tRNA-2-methylthio-N6-dimethylallyladenosine synthase
LEESPNVSKQFCLRTYGCQMNAHDSEKIANLLVHAGHRSCDEPAHADILIINTCSIRDKAEHRLYSDLGVLREWKALRPGRVLGVAGCVAQQVGDAIQSRFSHVDFVFGTHNLRLVPAMLAAALTGQPSLEVGESASLDRFELPERHPDCPDASPGRAYLTVMEGCDMFCSFCIVPTTRGREISRPALQIVAEAEALAKRGVKELLLLGQTVNAYGRHDARRGRAERNGTIGFGALLRRLAAIPGISRLRYTSPHPLFFDDDLIRAHADLDALCPHVHLPLQSGSDAVLAGMRRRYGADEYRGLVDRLRAARPDIALTTDLIVGFPGETDDDFHATLALVRDVGFVDAFSFKYSPRPGTAAAVMRDAVPGDVAQARLEVLQEQLRVQTSAAHRARVGQTTEVLVTGASRLGEGQLTGRDPYHRVVNFAAATGALPHPGELVPVRIVAATPHSLIGEQEESAPPLRRSLKGRSGRADEGEHGALLEGLSPTGN